MEQIAAYSIPMSLPIPGDAHREQRNWCVRLAVDVPQEALDETSALLTREAASAVLNARVSRGLAIDEAEAHVPVVRVEKVDKRHLVLVVATIKLSRDDGHDYLVAASNALAVLGRYMAIDDIQGIPRRYWSMLVGSSSSDSEAT